jgi:hypothetical protein
METRSIMATTVVKRPRARPNAAKVADYQSISRLGSRGIRSLDSTDHDEEKCAVMGP